MYFVLRLLAHTVLIKSLYCTHIRFIQLLPISLYSVIYFTTELVYRCYYCSRTCTKTRAYVVDTCGGCGSFQTQGSGAQRLALILANGPIDDGVVSSALSPPSEDSVIDYDGMLFEGNAGSKAFPSEARINVEIRKDDDDDGDSEPTYTVYMASSDGMGCTSKAKVINGGLQLEKSALYGCGWSTIDPLVTIPQPYKLLLLDDGIGATYQTQGFDIYLSMGDSRTGSGDMVGDDVYLKALYDERSSADTGGRRGTIHAAGLLSMVLVALATCYV